MKLRHLTRAVTPETSLWQWYSPSACHGMCWAQAWSASGCQVATYGLGLGVTIVCLTVPGSVPGVMLLISGGCSVLWVHKVLMTTSHMCWACAF
jgi:hypothetical protein